MKSLVVFESMYGNSHRVADIVGGVLSDAGSAEVVPACDASPQRVEDADLVVVGGPTHEHSLSTRRSRAKAAQMATIKDGVPERDMDPSWEGIGLREWFRSLPVSPEPVAATGGQFAAAFDTRINAHALLTGRASRAIARRLSRHGFVLVAEPQSFLVDQNHVLLSSEIAHAKEWAQSLLTVVRVDRSAPLDWMNNG